jgi:hypothetical protein
METLYIFEKMNKLIKERQESITETLCQGPVTDFTVFKELRARLAELAALEQGFKNLLERINND